MKLFNWAIGITILGITIFGILKVADIIPSELTTKYELITLSGDTFDMDVNVLITDDTAFAAKYVRDNLDSAVTKAAVPLVTIKNQFDRVKLELGEESYFGGNIDSITAKFYNSSQISDNSKSLTSTTLFTGDPVIQKPFWLDGEFKLGFTISRVFAI